MKKVIWEEGNQRNGCNIEYDIKIAAMNKRKLGDRDLWKCRNMGDQDEVEEDNTYYIIHIFT